MYARHLQYIPKHTLFFNQRSKAVPKNKTIINILASVEITCSIILLGLLVMASYHNPNGNSGSHS